MLITITPLCIANLLSDDDDGVRRLQYKTDRYGGYIS